MTNAEFAALLKSIGSGIAVCPYCDGMILFRQASEDPNGVIAAHEDPECEAWTKYTARHVSPLS